MSLNRLKKHLKQRNRELLTPAKSKFRWYHLFLVLVIIAAAGWPYYQQQRRTLPQQLLAEAEKLESLGQIDAAHKRYQQIYQDYPQHAVAPAALLRSGRIWQHDLRQDRLALLNYLQLEQKYPDNLLLQIAREEAASIVKYSLRDYSRAIGFYQRLIDSASDGQDKYLYEIADCYFRLDNYSQALIELETLEQEYPQTELLPELLYRKAGLLLLEKRPAEARRNWQRLIDKFPKNPYQVQARFNLAKLLEEDNMLEEALQQYRLLTDFPQPAILEEKIEHLKKRIMNMKRDI